MTYKPGGIVILALAICGCQYGAQSLEVANTSATLNAIVTEAAVKHSVPPQLAQAVVSKESEFQPLALSQGNYGLMQIRCGTARSVGFTGNCRELLKPEVNVEYGMRYLRLAMDRAQDDWCNAVTLYNRGIDNRPSPSKYCRKVMARLPEQPGNKSN
jgi:soluble lytic murein transglycosylase-like protein